MKFLDYLFWFRNKNNKKFVINRNWKKLLILFFIILLIWLPFYIFSRFNSNGLNYYFEQLRNIFSFDATDSNGNNLWELSFNSLWITILFVTFGSSIGFIFALITASFSINQLTNKYVAFFVNLIVLLLRSFPVIIFAKLFQKTMQDRDALAILYIWFTWLWLHRYVSTMLKDTDWSNFEIRTLKGNSKFISFWEEIIKRNKQKIISLYFYNLESNYRWISLLGGLGFIGIGTLIYNPLDQLQLNLISIPLFIFIVFLIINELASLLINNVLLNNKSKDKNTNYFSFINHWKTLAISMIFAVILIINITAIFNLKWGTINTETTQVFFSRLFQINFDVVFANSSTAPLKSIFEALFQTFIISLFVLIFSLILAILNNNLIWKKVAYVSTSILYLILRCVPVLVIYYITDILWLEKFTSLFFALLISYTLQQSKILTISINQLNATEFQSLKLRGWNIFKIIFKWILPKISKAIKDQALFLFENVFRSVIYYGVFNANVFGSQKYVYLNRNQYANAANYVWTAYVLILILEFIKWWILNNRYILKNIKFNYERIYASIKTQFTKKRI